MLSFFDRKEIDSMLSSRDDADAALHALFEANRLLRDAGERIASAAGQTHARRMVLQSATQAATVADIARSLSLQRQGVQRIADDLVNEGLARYEDNPRHRRSKLLVVTDAGCSILSEIRKTHSGWLDELRESAPGLDWSSLRRDLEYLISSLRNQR
ncbi:MarR family transcriptional regulator [Nocardia sp. NPDC051990]|uniref:MarR family winged helix-turn-helix transcriptional regulator n=1 Tax=Nocardia sp. NPDC051990 TaxID=3155285 RepID=UPI003433EEF9